MGGQVPYLGTNMGTNIRLPLVGTTLWDGRVLVLRRLVALPPDPYAAYLPDDVDGKKGEI